MICVTECIVCVPGHDSLIFSFLSFLFFDWVGVLWPKLSKVLKLVRWASRVLFPPVPVTTRIIIIMYIYHALINALSAHIYILT